jgi:hypothetical protein
VVPFLCCPGIFRGLSSCVIYLRCSRNPWGENGWARSAFSGLTFNSHSTIFEPSSYESCYSDFLKFSSGVCGRHNSLPSMSHVLSLLLQ